jgi:hypothetical protein
MDFQQPKQELLATPGGQDNAAAQRVWYYARIQQ